MIHHERIRILNRKTERKREYVLYWMQASQREECNHALEYAIERANELHVPVVVFFGITDRFPGANERHYRFMLEGLRETRDALERRGVRMVVRGVSPEKGVVNLARRASLVVVDRGYLHIQRRWRREAAKRITCPVIQVESDVVVPVEEVSDHEEYAAATIRTKILKLREDYLVPLRRRPVKCDSLGLRISGLDIGATDAVLCGLAIDRRVKPSIFYRGGTSEARRLLARFIRTGLDTFDERRNDPNADNVSHMSPYLHFGQISPLYIALRVADRASPGSEPYLEELIVRRELSMNFCFYNRRYDSFQGLPDWCRKTLLAHERDGREYVYSRSELEEARTHDPYWNAAQNEMRVTGKMHGYMRMYWGKKILEWRRSPADALRVALYLNNRYEIDGRDPNGFAGVAWCFGKHDRPWGERRIFGTIRYMNDRGLRRKFDADAYAARITRLVRDAAP
jgi:deoxyribodipyrimidine photo-lyase